MRIVQPRGNLIATLFGLVTFVSVVGDLRPRTARQNQHGE
jgi:hypothetical protein